MEAHTCEDKSSLNEESESTLFCLFYMYTHIKSGNQIRGCPPQLALRQRPKIGTTCSIKMSLAGQTRQTLRCKALLVQILTTLVRDLDTAISISSVPLLSLGEPNLISMGSSSCCWLFRLFATPWIDCIHSFLTQNKTHIALIRSIQHRAAITFSRQKLRTQRTVSDDTSLWAL